MIAHNVTQDIQRPRALKRNSSHSIRILHRPVMHIVPIYLSIIIEISFGK